MKHSIFILGLVALLSMSFMQSPKIMEKEVKTALSGYINAGDNNDADALQAYLHDNFRVAFFDASKQATSILDKETYSTFIREKKFGGYPRTPKYHSVQFIEDNMATVQVTLTSPGKPTLKNFYSLVKENNEWRVIQDFVVLLK